MLQQKLDPSIILLLCVAFCETSVFAMLPGLVMTNIAIEHGHLVR